MGINCFEDLEKVFDEINDKINPRSENVYYHYTDSPGLSGILKSKNLWHKDFKRLADLTEIIGAKKIIVSVLNSDNKDGMWNKALETFEQEVPKGVDIFVCSFCLRPDHLLAWRLYSEGGAGFSIGFKFDKIDAANVLPPSLSHVFSTNIIYDVSIFEGYIKDFVKSARQLKEKSIDKELKAEIDIRLLSCLISLLPSYKIEDFRVEHETRHCLQYVVHNGIRYPREKPSGKFITQEPKKYSLEFVKDDVEPIEIYCNDFDLDSVVEIWVGPRCEFEKAESWIKEILQENGFDSSRINIKKSRHLYK